MGSASDLPDDQYAVAVPLELPGPRYADDDEDYPPRPPAPRPVSRAAFLATVYRFPWRRDVIWRWTLLSGGLTPAAVLIGLAMDWSKGNSMSVAFALMVAALPMLMLLLGTLAYGVALFQHVFDASGGGADAIEAWPDSDWTDWLGQLIHLVYVAAIAGGLGYVMTTGAALGWAWVQAEPDLRERAASWPVEAYSALATFFIAFPLLFLSTQFANSQWQPISFAVVRSFASPQTMPAWALFLVTSAPIVLLVESQVKFAQPGYYALAALGFAPQLAAAWLIYARLLGRLGWEIVEHLPSIERADHADTYKSDAPTVARFDGGETE